MTAIQQKKRIKTAVGRIPCPMMGFLLRRVLDPNAAPDSHENRTRLGMLEGWVSTITSLLLCMVKGWLGLLSGSVSLMADATNNLTDMCSSLVVALGFQWSRKPSDEEHPFGHGRIEAVATLVLSIALLVVGVEVAKSGVSRLLNPQAVDAPIWLLGAAVTALAVKIWLAVFAWRLAKLSKSHVLEADAWNHTFDIAATLLVVIALFASRIGWSVVDGWTAIGVAIFIFFTGVKYAREAIDILLGKKPEPEELNAIHQIVDAVKGVLGVHEIIVHQYGDVKMVSFHIEVAANQSVMDAHHIAEVAESAVEEEMGWRAVAHVDPVDRSHPLFEELHQALTHHVHTHPEVIDFHDLRAEGDQPPYKISFDLVTDIGTRRDRYDTVYGRILRRIEKDFGDRVHLAEIGIEAPVDSAPMVRRQFSVGPQTRK